MTKSIKTYEWGRLYVGKLYGGVIFSQKHLDALHLYKVQHEEVNFFEPLYNQVCFNQFVGVIKIGDLTIEVLPKPDHHEENDKLWQKVLLNMLLISMKVEAKTTTHTEISLRQHSVLETYLQLFLEEVNTLVHRGLVKKYRTNISNQTALKGKLLIHEQITKNSVHAERFYVAHSVYDQDNIFNYIIKVALESVQKVGSENSRKAAEAFLLFFPECSYQNLTEKTFDRLIYDRKTEGYKTATDLARTIILNYHPDIKGGKNDILAIMFDMNLLWEKFIFWSLRKAAIKNYPDIKVEEQIPRKFWKGNNQTIRLQPDIVIRKKESNKASAIVIDTKWKYQSKTSAADVRQLFAYGQYFDADSNYLLYPDNLEGSCKVLQGNFFHPKQNETHSEQSCGLIFADIIRNKELNKEIGVDILRHLMVDAHQT